MRTEHDPSDRPLRELADRLACVVETASLGGSQPGRFLHVVRNGKAAHVALAGGDKRFWVTFWDSADPREKPAGEAWFESAEQVAAALTLRLI